jgi:hypothetical protein
LTGPDRLLNKPIDASGSLASMSATSTRAESGDEPTPVDRGAEATADAAPAAEADLPAAESHTLGALFAAGTVDIDEV